MEQYWQNDANCRSRVLKRLIENALLPVVYVICNLILKISFSYVDVYRYIQNSINRFALNTYTRL